MTTDIHTRYPHRIQIFLDDETYNDVLMLCQIENRRISQAIRMIVQEALYGKERK